MSAFNRNGKNATATLEAETPSQFKVQLGSEELSATPETPELASSELSYPEAAYRVLTEAGRAMDHREITASAMRKGWISPLAGTPELTLRAAVQEDIRRSRQRGETPRFSLSGSMIALSSWDKDALRMQVEERSDALRDRLLGKLRTVEPQRFGDCIGAVLTSLGYSVEGAPKSFDGELEYKGTLTVGGAITSRMAVQVRRQVEGDKLGPDAVRALRGSLELEEQGLLITTGDFTESARAEAMAPGRRQISLLSGHQLAALMLDFEIGVEATTLRVYDVTMD
jgi:restriction endonuclease Mrr